MNKTDTLVIIGDSWGCGAYTDFNGFKRDNTPAKGLLPDQYFTAKFRQYYKTVENHSQGGRSNSTNVERLINFIQDKLRAKEDLSKYKILILQTDPLRDIPSATLFYRINQSTQSDMYYVWDFFKNNDHYDLLSILRFNIEFFYHSLSIVAQKYRLTINLVGGLGAVQPCVTKYKNINVLVNSWLQLIDPEYNPSNIITSIIDIQPGTNPVIKEMYEGMQQIFKIQKKWCAIASIDGATKDIPNYLGYCNDLHPHHKGIDLLIDTIHDKIL